MKRGTKVKLLSLVIITQVSIIVGGFLAYQQMEKTIWDLRFAYKHLVEETGGPIIDFGLTPNPFAPLFPLVLLGLFSTIVLLIDELRHKIVEN